MRFYTATEIMHLLHLTNRQLQRLLATCSITYHDHPRDARLKLLTEDEFIQVQRQHQTEIMDLGQSPSDEVSALRAKVAALEAQLAARQTRHDGQHVPQVSEVALPPTRERQTHPSVPDVTPLPDGCVYLRQFGEAHHVPDRTAREHVRDGKIAETARPIPGQPDKVYHLLSPAQQEAALRFWKRTRGHDATMWHECEDGGCACHAL